MTLSELNLSKHNNTHIIFKCSKCSFESTKELFVDNHTEETYACKMCTFKTHHWLHLKKHTFQHKYAHSSIICCTLCTFTTKIKMSFSKKKIKLDPDIVKKEPLQDEESEEIDDIFEETPEASTSMKPENFAIKEEMGEEIDGHPSDANKGDVAASDFSTAKDKRNRDFICTICNYATKKAIDFTRHWLTHEEQSYTSENGVFVCQISDCFYVAPNEKNLLKHISNRHLHIYRCDFCYYVTYSKKEYDQHDSTHYTYQCDHSETPLKCKKCDFIAHHWFPYKRHINWHNYPPDSIVECGFCNFTTGDKALLDMHNAVHCAELKHCKMCRFTGRNVTELDKHCESVHDTTLEALDKLYKCKFCTCKFIGHGSKEKHEELHSKMGVLLKCCSHSTTVCPYCDYQDNQSNMITHIASKHAVALELENFRFENTLDEAFLNYSVLENLEACDKSDEQENIVEHAKSAEDRAIASTSTDNVSSNSNLTGRHAPQKRIKQVELEVKVEQSQHKCPFCYYNASSEDDYDVHCKTHSTFKCGKCPFESTKQLFVEDHTDNPWGCPKCNFKAHHWFLMKSHSFSHQEHKVTLLKCRQCNFETMKPSDMKKHCAIHTTEVLRCRICSFETRHGQVLRKHYSTRHNVTLLHDGSIPSVERPYECDLCVCRFKEQVYLDKHRALHENNGPFHLRCSQCRQAKKVIKPDEMVVERPDRWRECPYCGHGDEARYRMFQHLSRMHPSELEIEGYRFNDDQTQETISQTTTNIGSLTSDTTPPQIQGKPHTVKPGNTDGGKRNCDSIVNTGKHEDEKFQMKEESDDAGEGTSSQKQPGYILESMSEELIQRMFRCNACGYRTKGKCMIEKHMDQKHPPFLTECKVSADGKILCCEACCYTTKIKHDIKKHMLANHAIEEQPEEMAYFQIDKQMMKSMEEAESNNSTEEENIESLPKPIEPVGHDIEEVVIKVEPTTFSEDESVETATSEDLSANADFQLSLVPIFSDMSCSNKKIKLDPDIVHGDLQQEEETEKKDGIDIFEHLLLNTSGNIELDPEHFSIKAGKEEELMEMGEYTEEVYENPEEIYDGNQALYIKDEAESTFTAVKVPKFMCTICNYATNDPIDFTTHWLSHETKPFTNVNGEYVCQISDCLNVAPSKEAILVHIASQHVYRYRCGLCYYVTFSKKDYDQHRTTHYTYQCVKCNLKSTTLFFVQDHVAAPFKCDICNFTVHHWFPYKKHTNWHQYPADSIVQCELCDFTTGNQALLEKHKAIHFEKSILCKMCRFTGTNATELDNHYRDAHDSTLKAINKLHKCNFCTCKFISVGSKKMHEELHLKNDALLECCPSSKTVQCPYCDHQDIQRNDMISHILSKHAAALELDGFQFENGSDEIMLIYSRSTNLEGCDVTGIDGCKEDQDEHEEQQEANTEYEMIALSVGIAQDRGNDKLVNIQADKTGKMIQRLNDKLDSDRHLISAHTSEGVAQVLTFCCPRCPFTTSNQSLLHSHLLRHCILKSKYYKHESGKTVFSCNSQQTTSNESISTKHELEKEAARYTCSFCYYVAASKEDYDVHCGKHTTFKCSKCSFQATKRLFVEDHIENPWGCSKCDFKTHHWLPMKGHSFRHRDQTFLKCLICSFETTKPSVLASHWLRHTTVLLQCEPSLYKTISEKQQQANYTECHVGTLLDDVSRSTRDRLYECDLCACNFKHEMYLDKHRALHGENGPFHLKCCLCHQSKKITTSEKDRKHGYKPNSWSECPYCSYEDEMRYRMIEHLSNIHEKELEIEGYRFDDDQMEEIIPGRSTSIQNAPVKITSRPSVPQREDKPIDAVEFEMNIEEDIMTSAPAPNPSTNGTDSGHGIHQDKSTKEQQRVEDNDVIIKNETYDAQDSVPSLVDQVVIKVEMTCSPEEESLKDATSDDNLVCSRRGSEHHDRDITQMTDKSELANTFVPIYKESENIKQVLSGKMSGGNKKIKLEIMEDELVQDGEKGGVEKREVETKEEEALIVKNIKLEPANFFLKEEMDDEQMKVDEDIEEESETRLEIINSPTLHEK
nr:unnamed protein product [Callosobruchus chinensis]